MGWTLVGAGGWGYFPGGLRAYADGFRFVEVNATFYEHVPEARARSWRARVPVDFVFAVKVHRDVTHRAGLRATAGAREAFAGSLRTAEILGAPYAVLQTPDRLAFGRDEAEGLRDLAALAEGGPRLALEARAHADAPLPRDLRRLLADLAILDVVDLSRTSPRIPDSEVYSRLFGHGERNAYQFDDDELRRLDAAGGDVARAVFAFHGVRMYTDAARFLAFRRTGRFPPVTGSVGVASLEEVLREDARFPATREEIRRIHGWKLVEVEAGVRARVGSVLSSIPERRYASLTDLVGAVRRRGLA